MSFVCPHCGTEFSDDRTAHHLSPKAWEWFDEWYDRHEPECSVVNG